MNIINLYHDVFHFDYSKKFDWWYKLNPNGESIGVIVYDSNLLVGHFAVSPIEINKGKYIHKCLLSLAAMVRPSHQGLGVFGKLTETLFEYIKSLKKYRFIIGFPNDKSLNIHINKMGYTHVQDFFFIDYLKSNKEIILDYNYFLKFDKPLIAKKNYSLNRNIEYLNWRFNPTDYILIKNNLGNRFICSKFNNKIDILMWDTDTNEYELEDLSQYLIDNYHIEKVSRWESLSNLNIAELRGRSYHFCIKPLELTEDYVFDFDEWSFFMGDTELF